MRCKTMLYTVKDIAKLTGVTIKALHHYHKIGLLEPSEISDAGYRLYGEKELERLQQILFYKELDFSLKDIKKAMKDEPNRIQCLLKQQELIFARRQRMGHLLDTIKASIESAKKGEIMNKSEMFKGLNKEEWREALSEQQEYLKDNYGYDMLEDKEIDEKDINEKAEEAQRFLKYVKDALVNGWKASDERLQKAIEKHIEFMNEGGISINAELFAKQTKFFLEDDFHRNTFESMQTGLCYYLCIAAEKYALEK